jgi:uncharacterized protein YlxW (UPF0749 family)
MGGLGAILAIYLKGYSSGKKTAEQAEINSANKLNQELQETTAKNETLEAQREQDAKAVDSASGIDSLISMWNGLNQKAPSDPTDKKS